MVTQNILPLLMRSYSSSSAQKVKVPIALFGLDGRYATALYTAATKNKQLDVVEADLKKFQGLMKTDRILNEFVSNPIIKRRLKSEALSGIGTKLNFSSSSSNFLSMLAENGRLDNLNGIINSFGIIMASHRGDLPCEITSAKELDEATKQEVKSALAKFAKSGEKLLVTYKVDPAVIGGLVVSIGDKHVDMSIASKLKKYSDVLKSTV